MVGILAVAAFFATEGKKSIEAEKAVLRAEQMEKNARNAEKIRAKIAAWKAKKAGLYGPRKVYLPYQEPLPKIGACQTIKGSENTEKSMNNIIPFYARYSDCLFERE